jgi:hypothetical protein
MCERKQNQEVVQLRRFLKGMEDVVMRQAGRIDELA